MNSRALTVAVVVVLAVVGAWSVSKRDRVPHWTMDRTASQAAVGVDASAPKREVAIQDGKTIDFSSGTAVVKDDASGKDAIEKAVAAMDAAAKDVTFAPAK